MLAFIDGKGRIAQNRLSRLLGLDATQEILDPQGELPRAKGFGQVVVGS